MALYSIINCVYLFSPILHFLHSFFSKGTFFTLFFLNMPCNQSHPATSNFCYVTPRVLLWLLVTRIYSKKHYWLCYYKCSYNCLPLIEHSKRLTKKSFTTFTARHKVDCRTVVFFSKSVKKSVKGGVRVLRARSARASHPRLSPVSLSVFALVPDLLFDCSRVLEYAKIRTVLQSRHKVNVVANGK